MVPGPCDDQVVAGGHVTAHDRGSLGHLGGLGGRARDSPILVLNICPSIQTWFLLVGGLCIWTPRPGPSAPRTHMRHPPALPLYLDRQGPRGHAEDANQVVCSHTHPPLAWEEAEGGPITELAAEDWTPGDLGTGAPHTSQSEPLQIASLRGVPADEGHGQGGWSGRVRKG